MAERELTREEINKRIDMLARKRDHAADVLGKVPLALTYQQEIDGLVDRLRKADDMEGRERC